MLFLMNELYLSDYQTIKYQYTYFRFLIEETEYDILF